MATKRQDIVGLVIDAIETIDGTGDFETTIGDNVTDWGLNFQEDELPAVSVCDLAEEIVDDGEGEGYGELFSVLRLDVRIRVSVGSDTRPAECRKIIGDIMTALRSNQYWNDGSSNLALQTDFRAARFLLDEEKFLIAGVEVDIAIIYRIRVLDAFQ